MNRSQAIHEASRFAARAYHPIQFWVAMDNHHPNGLCYREFPVKAAYRDFFPTVWSLVRNTSATLEESTYHVIPDACSDLIFDLENGEGTIFGTLSRPHTVRMKGRIRLLGVRMAPHLIPALAGFPASEVRDVTPSLIEARLNPLQDLLHAISDVPIDSENCHLLVVRLAALLKFDRLHRSGKYMITALLSANGFVDRAARSMGLCAR